jgi:hypothetical protein
VRALGVTIFSETPEGKMLTIGPHEATIGPGGVAAAGPVLLPDEVVKKVKHQLEQAWQNSDPQLLLARVDREREKADQGQKGQKGRTSGWQAKRSSRYDSFLEECYGGRNDTLYFIQHGRHAPEAQKAPPGERGPPLRRIPGKLPLAAPDDDGNWKWGSARSEPSEYRYRPRIQAKQGKKHHRRARALKLVRDVQEGVERTSKAAGVLRMIMDGVQVREFRTPGQMWNARTLRRAIRFLTESSVGPEGGPVGVAAAGPAGFAAAGREGVTEEPVRGIVAGGGTWEQRGASSGGAGSSWWDRGEWRWEGDPNTRRRLESDSGRGWWHGWSGGY